jgi:hypothetical protein
MCLADAQKNFGYSFRGLDRQSQICLLLGLYSAKLRWRSEAGGAVTGL